MKMELLCAWRNVVKLFRFLLLYVGGVALLLYVALNSAAFLQVQYDALSGSVKLLAVAVFALAIAVWQYRDWRQSVREGSPR